LNIRPEQVDELDRAARNDFHQRLMKFLREQLPDETKASTDEELLARITQSEERAARYGIVSEMGVTQFVCLTYMAGPDFNEMPPIHNYLSQPSDDPDERLNELVEEIMAQEEEEEGG
jgi:hypothetical protein